MTLDQAILRAQEISKEYQCGQHVNYNVTGGYFYVSDWYDCDSTVATFSCGVKK